MKGRPGHTPTSKEPKYRVRRGKVVQIPPEWVGHTVHKQTKRQRTPITRRTRKSR